MILVTGGTGLLGSHLLLELIKNNNEVKVLIRPNSSKQAIKNIFKLYSVRAEEYFNKIIWKEGNLLDYESVFKAVEGVECVYNCAAIVSFNPCDNKLMLKTNIEGTRNIVNACLELKVKKICHVSSIAAIEDSNTGEFINENEVWNIHKKHSTYSESKYKSELEIWRGIEEGLQAVIVNPSIILGIEYRDKGSLGFFRTIMKGLNFYTPGSSGFVDVRDVAKCMILLIENNCFNNRYIVSSENVYFKIFFEVIAKYLQKKKPSRKLNKFTGNLFVKIEKLISGLLRREPRITKESIDAGFAQLAYSNKKIIEKLNFQFISLEDSVKNICKILVNEVD